MAFNIKARTQNPGFSVLENEGEIANLSISAIVRNCGVLKFIVTQIIYSIQPRFLRFE